MNTKATDNLEQTANNSEKEPTIFERIESAVTHIKEELQEIGKLDAPELTEELNLIENLAQAINGKPNIVFAQAKRKAFKKERDRALNIAQQMRDCSSETDLFLTTTSALREELKVNRALIYRFENDSQGRVVMESTQTGWTPSQDENLPCSIFGLATKQKYKTKPVVSVSDLSKIRLTPYQIQILNKFQVKASVVLPIYLNDENPWGLLVCQQCDNARNWQEEDINLLERIAVELSFCLRAMQSFVFNGQRDILSQINQDSQQILQTLALEVRQSLQADRVIVYSFNPDGSGEVMAESCDSQWQLAGKSFDQDRFVTAENCRTAYVVNDIYTKEFNPCFVQQLEEIKARAYIVVPIYYNDELLGMLGVYQNSATRNWQETEVKLTTDYAKKFAAPLKPASFIHQSEFQNKRVQKVFEQDFLTAINQEAQQSMQKMLKQILHLLQADRVLIYGFNPDGSGEVLSESVTAGWKAAGSSFDKDYFLTKDCQPYYVVNDIYTKGFTRCFIEALEALEAKAYITVPVCYNDELLGVLTVYQNSNPRNWQKSELDLMVKYATQFALPLQRTVYMRHTQFRLEQNEKYLARGRSLNRMLERIRSAKSKENVFQIATQEGRKLMDVDRLAVYRFDSDWSGKFIAESVTPGWTKLIDTMLVVQDTYLQETEGGRYKHGECFAVDDIYTVGHQDCHIELLEQFEARAYLIAPVFGANKKLWGLIAAYQNTGSRKWQQDEIDSLRQIGLQVGIAMEQIEYVENLEKKAEQEETISNLVDRIRGSLKLEQIFRNVTQEVRKVLESDRVVVYRFNPDWSGEVLAESYGTEWVSVMELQETDKSLYSTDMNANERCNLKYLQSGSALDKDTYFVNSQGGDYSRGKKFQVVDDIYKAGFSDCYLRSLEKYQARAYIIVPIFQDSKLWGLFAVYQNSDTRQWKTSELNLMLKVAPQLSIAIQQAEKSEKLKKTLDRQKGLAQMVDRMRDNSSLDKVLEIAAKESRKLLGVERSSIYQFNSDWTGQNVVEAPLDEEFQSMQATYFKTTFTQEPYPYLQKNQGGLYQNGDPYIVNDLSKSGLEERLREVLEKLNIKAYIRMPIFVDQQLWGIINLYQSQTRLWQEDDIEFIKQLASQIGIVIQQINYLEQVKTQSQNLTETLAREKAAKERLQQEAMQMLLSVKPAFSGDLTVRAQVTDNEIGTIAGAFNTTLDSLKDIVVQVQAAAEQVAITTGNSYGAVDKLSGQAQQQFLELSQALHQIQAMVDSTEITTTNATQVGMAISQANQTVQVGDKAMNNTVESINAIRQTVAEAEKRVKRLSESSQKISKVVNLISSFAAQTNLLALNAALEATRAGEYGKGFAVVADEVRNLSLQSSEATSEIEKLVQEIQTETQEVATAMNVGIQQVQEGTNLVKTTRENLNEIVAATNSISQLVEGITLAAEEQAKQAESVTEVVNQVAEIANTTSQDSNNISASFQELLAMAENLQNSVSQFKIK